VIVTWLISACARFHPAMGHGYIIAWPIAAITGYVILPMARRFTDRVVTRIGGAA